MNQIKNIFITLFLCGAFIANAPISAETIRAAIDFGSGAVKIQMAEVDTEDFLTARALYPNVQEDFLLAWDSGNGSFQMTVIKEGDLHQIYQGPLGHGTVRVILSKDIRRGAILQTHESGNPVLKKEAVELTQRIKELLAPVPDWLQKKLNSRNTVVTTFGDGESIFALVAQVPDHSFRFTHSRHC